MILHSSRIGAGAVNRPIRALIACILLALAMPSARAADWEFLPRIAVGAFTNDNYTLEPEPIEPVDVVGAQIDADFTIRATTPLTQFTLTPALESTIIPDDSEWESNDGFLRLDWMHRRQRFTAGLRAEYSDEATVKSELPSSDVDGDLGNPDQGDAGIVTVENRRQRLQVRPRMSFALTERSALLADFIYQDVDYDEEVSGSNEGTTRSEASVGYRFDLSPTSSLTLRGTASRYERKSDSVEADSYRAVLEWDRRLSDITRWYISAGAEQVDVPEELQVPGGPTSETGFQGGIGADWAFQVTKLFIDATASVEPNSTGRIIQREQLRFRLTRQFGPRSYGYVGARANRDRALTEEFGAFNDRDYATGTVGLEWRLSREFSLEAQYDYRWQEFEDEPSDASSNAFLLSIVYQRRRE